MQRTKLLIAGSALAGLAWWLWPGASAADEAAAQRAAALAAMPASAANTGLRDLFEAPRQGRVGMSPAASETPVDVQAPAQRAAGLAQAAASVGGGAEPADPQELARQEQDRKLGYHIAERYYLMSLSALREQAQRGDWQALTHLAERYMFQLEGHPNQPDHEPGFDYREAARQALEQAYLRGNLHAPAMLSESFLQDRQAVEAAAWNLLARKVGDTLSADWFLKTKDYQRLGEAEKAEAQRRADQLWTQMEARKAGR